MLKIQPIVMQCRKSISSCHWTHTLYLAVMIGLVIFNSLQFITHYPKKSPVFYGHIFQGIVPLLPDEQFIGYFTDHDLSSHADAMRFAQMQSALAPIIVDLNNPRHPFSLLDYPTEQQALLKCSELGLVPYKRSGLGILLCQSPK